MLVASYNNNEDAPHEPDGVALIWNMKYQKESPEYIFHCQVSKITSSDPLPFSSQRAKKVVSNCLGLVDFAIGLVNSVLNLLNGQVNFFEEFKLQKNCEINCAHQNVFGAS